jgi:putative peptidoglycan lipid II flippase
MVAFILSNLTGLVRQILVTNAFGTQADFDAFNAANRVAETLFNLVAGGALSSAFIPAFATLLAKGGRNDAWKLASAIGNLIVLILTLLSILAALFAPQVVRYLLAPGFSDNPAQEALTVALMRLMLASAVIFGLSGLVMGILNSHQLFFVPALAPSMYQFGMIIGVSVLAPRMGIFGLAWGVVLGSALHLGLQLPLLIRLKGKYYPTFGLKLSSVREVARLMGPRLLGVAVVQLNFWINTRLASQFMEGSVTAIVLAFTLMLMPQAAIAQSIAIAALPTFSAQVAMGKLDEMRIALANSLRGALSFSIPASIGLILLRKPIIALLYQRGAFNELSTNLVAWALLWYTAGLVGHSVVEITSRAFYSLHDTKTPVLIGIIAMSLNVAFSYLFSAVFLRLNWMPHGGLALANTVATALEAVGLVVLMRRRLGSLHGMHILAGAVKGLAAGSAMGLWLWGWLNAAYQMPGWLVVFGGIAIGGAVFVTVGLLVGIQEIRTVLAYLVRRLKRAG